MYQSAFRFVVENPQAAYQLLINSFMPFEAGMDKQMINQNLGLTFPNFSQDNQNYQPSSNGKNDLEIKNDSTKSKNLSEKSDKDIAKDEKSCSDDQRNSDESDDDDYLLKTHPFEIMYILNLKTNRKLKRMVCKLDGWNKIFEK